ncbi:MAG TPA: choline ABC transporter permease, partial [Kiloniellaceae bacterium]|nr:choline ABC transporter permease [Kiloniellaceae bacterium]
METLSFALANWDLILSRTGQHIAIVGVAVGFAILTGVPIGIVITRSERVAAAVLYAASIVITIPSIALFGMMIPILSL